MTELRSIDPYPTEGNIGGVVFEILCDLDEETDIEYLINTFGEDINKRVDEYAEDSEVLYDLRHAITGEKPTELTLVKGYSVEILNKPQGKFLRAARRVSIPNDLSSPLRFMSYLYE